MQDCVQKALSSFRQDPYRYNCAQAVAYGAGREDLIEPLALCGGGRAPEGLCGALYGAMQCVGEDSAAQLRDAFHARCGAVCCRQLKAEQKIPCEQCVSIAAHLLCE